MRQIIIIYLVVINIFTFIIYGIDKYRSVKKEWRISENTLIIAAVIGGSAGALLGMKMFRHKTRHPKFAIGIPVILLVQLLVYYFAAK